VGQHQGRTQHAHLGRAQDPPPAAARGGRLPGQRRRAQTNPADLTRNINRIQQALIVSDKDKTLTLRDKVS
jgi:hypothetical protein